MRILIALILLLNSSLISYSQKDEKICFDEDWELCDAEYAKYYRIVTKNKKVYDVIDYNLQDKIQMTGHFSDEACETKNGKFEWFDEEGKITKSCSYINNALVGDYSEYYPNGQFKIRDYYVNNLRHGYYEEYFEDGNLKAKAIYSNGKITGSAYRHFENQTEALKLEIDSSGNGSFILFHPNGKKRISGGIINGLRKDSWTYYDTNGIIRKTEIANDLEELEDIYPNKLSSHKISVASTISCNLLFFEYYAFDYEHIEGYVDNPDTDAKFPGGNNAMAKFIGDNLVYPEDAVDRNKQGTVYVRFVIEKDGNITQVKVEKGPYLLRAEAIRVVESMPRWKPGEDNGVKVPTCYRLPIKYVLE